MREFSQELPFFSLARLNRSVAGDCWLLEGFAEEC
jgi:hypothetical protein